MDAATITQDVMPYATAAVNAYGAAVLAKTHELAADSTPARGSRILQRIFGRGDTATREVIEKMAANPGDDVHRLVLQMAISDALHADPMLAGEINAVLQAAYA